MRMSAKRTVTLVVVTLEPGLYFPGRGGIRIEDSFFVSEAGVECWTEGNHALVG